MQSDATSVNDLVGLLLQEKARLDRDLSRQAITKLLVPAPSSPGFIFLVANQVSRNQINHRPHQQSLGNSSASRGQDNNNRRRRLHYQLCNKPDHEAINCLQCGNQTNYPSRRPLNRDQPRQAHTANYHSPSTVMDPSWYFDTRATNHVTLDLTKLHITKPCIGEDKLQVGNRN